MSELVVYRVIDLPGLVEWQRVMAAAHEHDYLDLPADPVTDAIPMLERQPLREAFEYWVGRSSSDVVAAGKIRMPLLDNLDTANIDLKVSPAERRRGHGRRLLQALRDRVGSLGRSRILMETAGPLDPDRLSPGELFASAMAAEPVTQETRSRLDVAALDVAQLDAEIRALEPGTAAYRLVSWSNGAPSAVVPGLAVLYGRMSTDAPLDDLQWEPESWGPDRYLDLERLCRERGRQQIATAAIEKATGLVVGFTVIGVNELAPEVAQQSETIVDPRHRGHRLGMLLKLVNEKQLIAQQPRSRVVVTWNAAVNVHMIAINDTLGFTPVDRWREWQLDL